MKAVYQHLKDKAPIIEIVGDRLYPHWLPQSQSTYPVVTIMTIGVQHDHSLSGAAGMAQARVQIDAWGHDLGQVYALAEAVRQELHGFKGDVLGDLDVAYVQLDNERDAHEAPKDGSDKWLFRRSADYLIKYAETIPTF